MNKIIYEIKSTPILKGRHAKEFLEKINQSKNHPISKEALEKIKKSFNGIKCKITGKI